jgi:hypothetical protein
VPARSRSSTRAPASETSRRTRRSGAAPSRSSGCAGAAEGC